MFLVNAHSFIRLHFAIIIYYSGLYEGVPIILDTKAFKSEYLKVFKVLFSDSKPVADKKDFDTRM